MQYFKLLESRFLQPSALTLCLTTTPIMLTQWSLEEGIIVTTNQNGISKATRNNRSIFCDGNMATGD